MKSFIFTFITLFSSPVTDPPLRAGLIVWNVGQGQFVTWLTQKRCQHFDSGGEVFPEVAIRVCRAKANVAVFSHWDKDHIQFARKLQRNLISYCVSDAPPRNQQTPSWWAQLTLCTEHPVSLQKWEPLLTAKKGNDLSRVWMIANFALVSGDSPQQAERIWARLLPLKSVFVFLLGHHGSRTSTSQDLLSHLPQARMAIASARWARYHHPHSQVEAKLRKSGIALLRTEDWGHIWIEAPPNNEGAL